jgi:hypothetical protein
MRRALSDQLLGSHKHWLRARDPFSMLARRPYQAWASRRLPGAWLSASSACIGQLAARSGWISWRSPYRNAQTSERQASSRSSPRRESPSSWVRSCHFGSCSGLPPDGTQAPAVSLLGRRSAIGLIRARRCCRGFGPRGTGHDGKRDLVRGAVGSNLAAWRSAVPCDGLDVRRRTEAGQITDRPRANNHT